MHQYCCFRAPTRALHTDVISIACLRLLSTRYLTMSWEFPRIDYCNLLFLYEYLLLFNFHGQKKVLRRMSETICRLRSLFGSGWFFEWPRGKRPLNSTWPWADVKPSLLVLWGVCWMFVVASTLEVPRGLRQSHPSDGNHNQLSVQQSNSDHYYFTSSGE